MSEEGGGKKPVSAAMKYKKGVMLVFLVCSTVYSAVQFGIAASAIALLSASTDDIVAVIRNWEMLPIDDIVVVAKGAACPADYVEIMKQSAEFKTDLVKAHQVTFDSFSGIDAGCECFDKEAPSKDADGASWANQLSRGTCDSNQTAAQCNKIPKIDAEGKTTTMYAWREKKICAKYGTVGAIQRTPLAKLADSCPSGHVKCGPDADKFCHKGTQCPISEIKFRDLETGFTRSNLEVKRTGLPLLEVSAVSCSVSSYALGTENDDKCQTATTAPDPRYTKLDEVTFRSHYKSTLSKKTYDAIKDSKNQRSETDRHECLSNQDACINALDSNAHVFHLTGRGETEWKRDCLEGKKGSFMARRSSLEDNRSPLLQMRQNQNLLTGITGVNMAVMLILTGMMVANYFCEWDAPCFKGEGAEELVRMEKCKKYTALVFKALCVPFAFLAWTFAEAVKNFVVELAAADCSDATTNASMDVIGGQIPSLAKANRTLVIMSCLILAFELVMVVKGCLCPPKPKGDEESGEAGGEEAPAAEEAPAEPQPQVVCQAGQTIMVPVPDGVPVGAMFTFNHPATGQEIFITATGKPGSLVPVAI